ncbi:MAG: hypothetical protein H7255_20730 [Ramlibacter sp.]|nr:hypothetical protein [Ramlibacter sp.]
MTDWFNRKCIAFSEWFCWSVWNYARRRSIRREKWHPGEAETARNDLSPDQRRIYANEAQQVLDNRHFIDAFNAVNASLEDAALGCNPDNKETAARIVISKQLLHGVRRELVRKVNDGYMAEAEIYELQRRNQPVRFQR